MNILTIDKINFSAWQKLSDKREVILVFCLFVRQYDIFQFILNKKQSFFVKKQPASKMA